MRFGAVRLSTGADDFPLALAPVDALERYLRAGMELIGEEVDDVDVAVVRAAEGVYGSALQALDTADLAGVWPEPDLDPSRAPRPPR